MEPGSWPRNRVYRRPHRTLRLIVNGRAAVLENIAGDLIPKPKRFRIEKPGICLPGSGQGTASRGLLINRTRVFHWCCCIIAASQVWCHMEIEKELLTHREAILEAARKHGAYNVRVFGSVARGEADPESDIDFLVNLEAGRSLMDLARLLRELQSLLGRNVDIVTEAGLRTRIRPQVLKDARAF